MTRSTSTVSSASRRKIRSTPVHPHPAEPRYVIAVLFLTVATPPPWLVSATPAVALVALVIAIASFGVAYATYRRAAPRVVSRFNVHNTYAGSQGKSAQLRTLVNIVLQNRGLAPVGIDSFSLGQPFFHHLRSMKVSFYQLKLLNGEVLSTTLAPNASLKWTYEVRSVMFGRRKTTDPDKILRRLQASTLVVHLGSGRDVRRVRIDYDGILNDILNNIQYRMARKF